MKTTIKIDVFHNLQELAQRKADKWNRENPCCITGLAYGLIFKAILENRGYDPNNYTTID